MIARTYDELITLMKQYDELIDLEEEDTGTFDPKLVDLYNKAYLLRDFVDEIVEVAIDCNSETWEEIVEGFPEGRYEELTQPDPVSEKP